LRNWVLVACYWLLVSRCWLPCRGVAEGDLSRRSLKAQTEAWSLLVAPLSAGFSLRSNWLCSLPCRGVAGSEAWSLLVKMPTLPPYPAVVASATTTEIVY